MGEYRLCLDKQPKQQLREAGVRLDTPVEGMIDWSRSIDHIVDAVKSESAHGVALTVGEKGLAGRIAATRRGRPNQATPYGTAKLVTSPDATVRNLQLERVWDVVERRARPGKNPSGTTLLSVGFRGAFPAGFTAGAAWMSYRAKYELRPFRLATMMQPPILGQGGCEMGLLR